MMTNTPDQNENSLLEGKVLVVDDESSIRNVVRMYLEYHGLTVKEASDGAEALKMVGAEPFDVVLSDIMMPNMDGLTMTEEIQKIQPNTMIVLMTGYASVNTAVDAIKKDVFDYILKPFQNMQIVLQSVKRAIERKRLLTERKMLIEDLQAANRELDYNRGLLEERIHEIDSELGRRVKRLSILYDISRSLTSINNLDVLLETIMNKISMALNNTMSLFLLAEHGQGILRRIVTSGLEYETPVPDKFGIIEGVPGEVMRSGHVVIVRDLSEMNDPVLKNIARGEKILSLVAVPVRYESEKLGIIIVMFRDDCQIIDDDVSLLVAVADQASMSIKNTELYSGIQRMFRETIEALATAIDSRDNYTGGHSNMVTRFACKIAERMGFDENQVETVRISGILHDVGKIGITDVILNKPGRLTEEEMGVIKAHPMLGRFIVESIDALKPVARIIYHHHERFDGKGYPDGISGEQIPIESRILQVADIFDAITSDRVYRKGLPLEKAMSIILEGSGTASDPEIVRVFNELYLDGTLKSIIE